MFYFYIWNKDSRISNKLSSVRSRIIFPKSIILKTILNRKGERKWTMQCTFHFSVLEMQKVYIYHHSENSVSLSSIERAKFWAIRDVSSDRSKWNRLYFCSHTPLTLKEWHSMIIRTHFCSKPHGKSVKEICMFDQAKWYALIGTIVHSSIEG